MTLGAVLPPRAWSRSASCRAVADGRCLHGARLVCRPGLRPRGDAHRDPSDPRLLLATLALIALCGLSAWLLTHLLGIDGLTAFLATSPGGLNSVAIIAVGSGADVPLVLAIQTLRLFLIILVGPPLARLIARAAPVPYPPGSWPRLSRPWSRLPTRFGRSALARVRRRGCRPVWPASADAGGRRSRGGPLGDRLVELDAEARARFDGMT